MTPTETEVDYARRLEAMTEPELRQFVDDIMAQIDRDERRNRRVRWLMIVGFMAVAWCLGAACALEQVAR